ncbi:DUF2691 family protein [Paenibacillus sp. IHBB 10380]|uniref:DUF2691 family protein n=1 Tax=Paenibacillus sp. IHBB 10380 TaxID=1566358 RepID=UPI0005CFD138|nr:DUF2691 family protein [Paenibacillus sp. IHBB 10380]AJS58977.1 prophage protein [Paenibacillus sp. IHBB 10380]
MKRGIIFEIPNENGRFLGDILMPFDTNQYNWRVGGEESYLINNNKLDSSLFPEQINCMDGETLKSIIEDSEYYLIFQDLKAYPKGKNTIDVRTYEEFMGSDCQLVLLVVDSSYITVYCKSKEKLEELYLNAYNQGYINLEYITDENDMRTRLSVW